MSAAILGIGLILPPPQPTMLPPAASELLALGPAYACAELPLVASLPARAQRRFGRTQRLALGVAQQAIDVGATHCVAQGEACLAPTGSNESDPWQLGEVAVLVGTGLGCLGETAAFLENMVLREEREPMPARFVNSVHNAPAAQIAIAFGLRGESTTFTHEAISFELALWEALRLLATGRAEHVLVVGVDELSPYAITAGQEYGWWRRDAAPLAPMAAGSPPGTLPGEGAAALLLGRAGSHGPRLAAVRVRPLPDPDFRLVNPEAEVEFIRGALDAAGKTLDGVDLFLFGANGDPRLDAVYAEVARRLGGLCGVYKHLCGEFCTAPAVGVALAARSVRDGRLAPENARPYAPRGDAPSAAPAATIRWTQERPHHRPHAERRGEQHETEGMSPGYPPEGVKPSGGSVAVYHVHEAGYHSICLVTA